MYTITLNFFYNDLSLNVASDPELIYPLQIWFYVPPTAFEHGDTAIGAGTFEFLSEQKHL